MNAANQQQSQLQSLGLTQNEAVVYHALLELGSAPARAIALQAGLNRSTTYVQLDNLISYGLVSSHEAYKKTVYVAESPENLRRFIEQRIDVLENQRHSFTDCIPDLLRLYSTSAQRESVRMFVGLEGLRSMRESVIQSGVAELFVFTDFDSLYKLFSSSELQDYSRRRAASGIHSNVLYTKQGRAVTQAPQQTLYRVDKTAFPFTADIYVYGDTVSICTVEDDIVGVTIENAALAMTMRSIFYLARDAVS